MQCMVQANLFFFFAHSYGREYIDDLEYYKGNYEGVYCGDDNAFNLYEELVYVPFDEPAYSVYRSACKYTYQD